MPIIGAPYRVYTNGEWKVYYLKTHIDAVVDTSGNTLTNLLLGKVNVSNLSTNFFEIAENGTVTVKKATTATTATSSETADKVSNSLSIRITDGDNVGDISIIYDGSEEGVLNLNNKYFENESITVGGATHKSLGIKKASTEQAGLMTADMVNKLNTVYSFVNASSDSDNIINKVQEIVAVFEGYDEEFNLAETLTALQEDLDKVETDSVKIGVTPADGYSNVLASTYFEKSANGYITIKDGSVHAKSSETATTAGKVANSYSFTIADSASNFTGVVQGWSYNGSASVGVKLDDRYFKYDSVNEVVQLQQNVFVQSAQPGVVREGTVWIQTSA